VNFELSEEQVALHDSVTRLLARHYSFEQRRRIAASAEGWAPAVWSQLAELGVTGLLVPAANGGFGGSLCDMLPVLQAIGGALALEPLLSSAVLAVTALKLADPGSRRDELLSGIAAGTGGAAWCHDEADGRHAPLWMETRATRDGGDWRLDGIKCNVLHGAQAQALLVTARIATGAPDAPDGLGLFLVEPGSPGVCIEGHRLMDDSPAAEVRLKGAAALPLCLDGEQALRIIESTLAAGMAAACADSVGAMDSAYRLALDYMRTRKQFGRFIGENQALRHRAAEMLVSLEMCRSMVVAAAVAADDFGSESSRAELQRAKIMLGRHGRTVCHSAVQIHGGIGMTEEYAVGHCLRRVVVMDQLFGDADAHAARRAAAFVTGG